MQRRTFLKSTLLAAAAPCAWSQSAPNWGGPVVDTHLHLRRDADACFTHMQGCGVTHAVLLTVAPDEERAKQEMEKRSGRFARSVAYDPAKPDADSVIRGALAPSGFMEFARYDLGAFLRKESGRDTPKIIRFVVGNPLIMKEMVKHVPDAGSYAPVTVLIDERADGVHLSYDTMVGFLTPYRNEQALSVARDLDAKVERLLRQAAA